MSYKFDDPTRYRYETGGLFLGKDGENNEIGFTTERHAITIGGSGAGKGSALLVPNCRRWPQSLICIDTKGENAALSWEARETMGQKLAILDPFHETDAATVPRRLIKSFNPLQGVDPASQRAVAEIKAIANGLVVVHNKDHMEWTEGARGNLAGLIAYIIATKEPAERHFGTLRDMLTQPNETEQDGVGLYPDAQRMAMHEGNNSIARLIRSAGNAIMTGIEAEKGMEKDFLGLAKRATSWLDDDAIQSALSHSTFDLHDLVDGKTSVFLVLPADYIKDYSAFLRLFVKTALHIMGGNKTKNRCLFLLDEFYSLGKMEELAESSGRMRSYGVSLWPFLQNLSQITALYGQEEADTFFANADVHCFLGNDQDVKALRYMSERIGPLSRDEITLLPPDLKYTTKNDDYRGLNLWWDRRESESEEAYWKRIEAEDENRRRKVDWENARARAEYEHAMKRVGSPRLTPDEIAALVGKDEGDTVARSMIVFLPRHKVLQLKLAPYFIGWADPDPAFFEERPTKKPRSAPVAEPVAPVVYAAPPQAKDKYAYWGMLALLSGAGFMANLVLHARPLGFVPQEFLLICLASGSLGVVLLRHTLLLSRFPLATLPFGFALWFLMPEMMAAFGQTAFAGPQTIPDKIGAGIGAMLLSMAPAIIAVSGFYLIKKIINVSKAT